MMIVSWLSFSCFFIAALFHLGFFVFEVLYLPRPEVFKNLGYSKESMKDVRLWAFNVGIYNLCLSVGTFAGLYMVIKKQIILAGALTGFCGITMVVCGFALWFSAPKLRRWALVQALPPGVGLFFLYLHIIDRLGLS